MATVANMVAIRAVNTKTGFADLHMSIAQKFPAGNATSSDRRTAIPACFRAIRNYRVAFNIGLF